MLSTSVEVICYKSKRLKDGTFPLMLRITKARKRKYAFFFFSYIHLVKRVLETIFACNIENDEYYNC